MVDGGQGASTSGGWMIFTVGLLLMAYMIFGWFGNVVRESRAGLYSPQMDRSFRWGMSWFIFSEIMLSSLQVLAALTLVLLFPRPLSWLTHPVNEAPVFRKRAAFLTAIIIVIVIIQSGTFQTTPFIYFRF